MPHELPDVVRGCSAFLRAARTRAWRNMTVKEVTVNTLVGVEVLMWFFAGECIGKGSLIGYQV